MRQRVRVLFTFLAAGLMIIGAVMAILPVGIVTASHSNLKNQPVSQHVPHLFYKPGSHQARPFSANNLIYGGGPVMTGTTNAYAIFWEPGGNVSANYNSLIERYLGDVGASPLYSIANQYMQTGGAFPSNSVLAGSWVDSSAYTETPLLDSDIQAEVTRAQQANSWTSSLNNIFFVFTGSGENLCIDGTQAQCATNTFCAYHSFFGGTTIYAAMPYAASFTCNPGSSPNNDDADQTINVSSHEQMEAATDPLLNAWTDSIGNEIGDKCAWQFGSLNGQGADVVWNNNPYIVQEEWDNNTSTCRLTSSITPPTPTPTNTPTPTPTPTPPPVSNLIKNGGFEHGRSPWFESSSGGFELIDKVHPHTGSYSVFLCGYNRCKEAIYQVVSIPSTVTSANLTFYWYMSTSEPNSHHTHDFMYVRVRNQSGLTLKTLQTLSNGSSKKKWYRVTCDVTAYKGKTIQIAFVSTTDGSKPTNFFVDDVALNIH